MKLIGLTVMTALLTMIGIAQATLTVIGTAQFNGTGTEYNLIWEDDNNGNSVVWLDYCNTPAIWQNQTAWAVGLNNELVITLTSLKYPREKMCTLRQFFIIPLHQQIQPTAFV